MVKSKIIETVITRGSVGVLAALVIATVIVDAVEVTVVIVVAVKVIKACFPSKQFYRYNQSSSSGQMGLDVAADPQINKDYWSSISSIFLKIPFVSGLLFTKLG